MNKSQHWGIPQSLFRDKTSGRSGQHNGLLSADCGNENRFRTDRRTLVVSNACNFARPRKPCQLRSTQIDEAGAREGALSGCFTGLARRARISIKRRNHIALVPPSSNDDRVSRIVHAALEIFSERSFADADTNEIARRAGVSKRDIYANFADKHSLLEAVIKTVLQADDENFSDELSVS